MAYRGAFFGYFDHRPYQRFPHCQTFAEDDALREHLIAYRQTSSPQIFPLTVWNASSLCG